MDRDAPLRSQVTARRAGLLVVLVALAWLLLGAGSASAEGWVPGPPSDDQTVSLARAGAQPATANWIDSGPVVPLLLVSTVAMLAGGCVLLWSRCRVAADR
jgi:uncharacterized membrane protein YphA (DoxX/SURF4 family)